ncbi:O-methyltransferase [Barrientosiimonas marina]|uniref:tRNA 5-hydroxyuridine methyltransferase n=1 Tax=Lentibacillus kimchii TaxID=1542911 RepID=A0ABW2V154_9BACI
MDEKLRNYLTRCLPSPAESVMDLEEEAARDRVPIMDPLGMDFVMQLIRLAKPERILEIGTAIGYSALRMLEANPSAEIWTIEKDDAWYRRAEQNIQLRQKQDHIHVLYGDALEKLETLSNVYFDLILIDAAKGKYQRFFELAAPLLRSDGFILTDNVLFKGYVADKEKQHPRYQAIAEKLRAYNSWLVSHPDFTTTFVPIGDGIAISSKDGRKE